jgi:hypothetical protein
MLPDQPSQRTEYPGHVGGKEGQGGDAVATGSQDLNSNAKLFDIRAHGAISKCADNGNALFQCQILGQSADYGLPAPYVQIRDDVHDYKSA